MISKMKKQNKVLFSFSNCKNYIIIIFDYFIATGENTPEHSSSNAEATAMAIIEEDAPEVIRFQEFQNTPVSSAVIYTLYFQR